MPSGTVKWFNNAKGYGFILPDEGGEDLFVHYTSILMDGYKTLKAGQAVTFDVVKGGKGLHATNIKTSDSATSSPKTKESETKSEAGETATESEESAESESRRREVETL